MVEQIKKEFTSISEIRQIEILLNFLESKIYDFHQIFPRLERRLGLVNLGGSILNTLFGTATIADIQRQHDTLNELKL